MHAELQKEHQWLQKLVGEWTYEVECVAGPDQPASKHSGSESVRSLGGIWTVAEGRGEMPGGGSATTIMTLGYDTTNQRFVGTFIASMMTHLWLYNGALDEAGKVLALRAEGPDCTGGSGTVKYMDAIEFVSDDRRILTSSMLSEDGTWRKFMTATYRRVK